MRETETCWKRPPERDRQRKSEMGKKRERERGREEGRRRECLRGEREGWRRGGEGSA